MVNGFTLPMHGTHVLKTEFVSKNSSFKLGMLAYLICETKLDHLQKKLHF